MLVEAVRQTVRSPGPLRDFYQWVGAQRGDHIAAAVGRKPAVIVWHMVSKGNDYAEGQASVACQEALHL
jgi:hypothetical protein